MTVLVRGLLWLVVYLAAVVAPLFFMLVGEPPPGRGWWMDLSLALGFVGLAMMGLQFAVTARFHPIDAPYGLDAVLQFHRQISFVALGFILAHPAILFVERPARLSMLNPLEASWMVRWGLVSTVLLLVLVALSVWRRQLRLGYEAWRVSHGLLAIVVVAAALIHIWQSGYYVSGPWRRGIWLVMAVVLIGLLVWVRIVKPWLLLRRPYTVTSVRPVGRQVWALTVEPDGHPGLRFDPGQFAWLMVDRSPFGVREHPFSLSSSAESQGTYEFTIKELGDFTSTVGAIEPGTRAYLDGPFGAFSSERRQGAGYVLIAGGVGIAPMMSMLRTMEQLDEPRPITLLYGNPSRDEVIYADELAGLAQRLDLTVVHVLERPPEGWDGEAGVITRELLQRHLPSRVERHQVFICGPDAMMDAVEHALRDLGVPADNINFERFEFV